MSAFEKSGCETKRGHDLFFGIPMSTCTRILRKQTEPNKHPIKTLGGVGSASDRRIYLEIHVDCKLSIFYDDEPPCYTLLDYYINIRTTPPVRGIIKLFCLSGY